MALSENVPLEMPGFMHCSNLYEQNTHKYLLAKAAVHTVTT